MRRVPDPGKAPAIIDMAKRVLGGEPLYSVAKDYKQQDARWTPSEVRRALLRPTYAGLRVHYSVRPVLLRN